MITFHLIEDTSQIKLDSKLDKLKTPILQSFNKSIDTKSNGESYNNQPLSATIKVDLKLINKLFSRLKKS